MTLWAGMLDPGDLSFIQMWFASKVTCLLGRISCIADEVPQRRTGYCGYSNLRMTQRYEQLSEKISAELTHTSYHPYSFHPMDILQAQSQENHSPRHVFSFED